VVPQVSYTQNARTLAEEVHQRIRGDILAGRLLPGQRLKLALLCQEHGVSLSIVREALTRLAAEKLVRAQPQQGFAVTSLSVAELQDLTFVRITIESVALRRAIERGGVDWEARLLATHHTLLNTPVHTADDPKRLSEAYAQAHAQFHDALTAPCDSPRLRELQRSLYDTSELYRRLSYLLNRRRRNKAAEHRALMDAALARDADRAVALLAEHYESTTRTLVASGILGQQGIGDAA
jgi:DNA-binding GntR family transcriptional regulator